MDINQNDFVFVNKTQEDSFQNQKAQSYLKTVVKKFFHDKFAVAGVVIIGLIVFLAIFGPLFSKNGYSDIVTRVVDGKEVVAKSISPVINISPDDPVNGAFAGETFIFGTDNLGRDLWSRTMRGARISLLIAFATIIIDVIFGMTYGLVSGYVGGRTDGVMQRIIEIVNSIPRLVIVAVLAIFMPKGIGLVIVALSITEWIGMSKIARAQMLKTKNLEFVMASRTLGAGSRRIIFSDVLPNTMTHMITQILISIPGAIFTESFLSFVGVGIMPPECSIGSLIQAGFQNLSVLPYQIIPPTLILALLMIGFNAIGNGIKRATEGGMGDA